ncbi:hypothetical protein N2152v2_003884 [Parachlorella kessleri]
MAGIAAAIISQPTAAQPKHAALRQHAAASFVRRRPFTKAAPSPCPSRGRLQIVAAVKKAAVKNVVCSKTLVVKPGKEDQVAKLCKTLVEFSHDRMRDRGSGINAFECSQDNWDKNVFHFWERYESNTHLGRHNTAPEFKSFMEKVQPLLEAPVGMALYEWRDGQLGNAAMQGGPKGEGGLDDATGASGSSGGASMKQTSATVDLTNIEEEPGERKDSWGLTFKLPWLKNNKKDKK